MEKHLDIKDIESDPMKWTEIWVSTDKLIETIQASYACGRASKHES